MTKIFPGIDPFIEDQHLWPDFHSTMIQSWRDALRKALPSNYIARIDERISVVEYSELSGSRFGPDVSIEHLPNEPAPKRRESAVAVTEPVVIELPMEEEIRESYIKILHHPDKTLVGVLELLSPTNKDDTGRAAYRAKRLELLNQSIHLVELDLLIGGQRLPLKKPYPRGDYFALIARADRRPDCHVYAWSIRDQLPTIPIPLLPEDGEIAIDLAAVYRDAIERGEYWRSIDYRRPLNLALSRRDLEWAKKCVADE